METDPKELPRKVGIIGGGITGLSAAWHLLENNVDFTLFECSSKLGGHANTLTVSPTPTESIDVDVGFMVFNDENYPNMTRWFERLDVQTELSDMSLAISLDGGQGRNGMEWSSHSLNGVFANRHQLLKPSFYQFLKDMLRFNREAATVLTLCSDDPRRFITTRQYLRQEGYSEAFAQFYLLPMMAALWSASLDDVLDFPVEQLVGFLCHHRMLQLFHRPQWKTVKNRSKSYTHKMTTLLGPRAKCNTSILKAVPQMGTSGTLYQLYSTSNNNTNDPPVLEGTYTDLVFACPPPVARTILEQGHHHNSNNHNCKDYQELYTLLSNVEYAPNKMYLHSDAKLMPASKRAWSSWNCLGKSHLLNLSSKSPSSSSSSSQSAKTTKSSSSSGGGVMMEGSESGFGNKLLSHDNNKTPPFEGEEGRMRAVYVTYHLNRLQNLQTSTDIFVSLNPHTPPRSELVHEELYMSHPQFTVKTLQARKRLQEGYQGREGLWFCGAWMGFGFHEDGCRSGLEVAANLIDKPVPWAPPLTAGRSDSDTIAAVAASGGGWKEGMVLPPPNLTQATVARQTNSLYHKILQFWKYTLPVAVCKRLMIAFLQKSIHTGVLQLKLNDGSLLKFGQQQDTGTGMMTASRSMPKYADGHAVTVRVFEDWFFVKAALEYDLGLARSYMAGYFLVEPLSSPADYDPIVRPAHVRDETTAVLGDPVGLTRLFLLFIANRDNNHDNNNTHTPTLTNHSHSHHHHVPKKSARMHTYSNALSNASGLLLAKFGSLISFLKYKLYMDNSERGGSLNNIHAHYDLSNDLFRTFLDKETLMYSSSIYDAAVVPVVSIGGGGGEERRMVFRGSLEQAQWRKLDTLLDRAQVKQGQTLLDIGFGWGGLCLHAARKYKCKVHGITLSVEQKALAEERIREAGVEHLITFEVVDYRTFARRKENWGKFDRVLSCEMIEAVGHEHLGEFFWAVEQVLKRDGVFVMEAITTPEERYETYRRSTDFINSIIFPGSCCPSLHALIDASYKHSTLTLEHIDNIGLHYARTLAEWRRRFNAQESTVRKLGFDDVFLRVWNYYFAYCEAGFHSQTEHCLILVFSRPGCRDLMPLSESRSVTQLPLLGDKEMKLWIDNTMDVC